MFIKHLKNQITKNLCPVVQYKRIKSVINSVYSNQSNDIWKTPK
jgi:hypothetical protein